MWYCDKCKNEFDEPERKEITFEEYYGVDHLFPNRNKTSILTCPFCGEEDEIEEMRECDQCGEWTRECDLEDSEGLVGGNIGYLCPQCIQDCEVGQ